MAATTENQNRGLRERKLLATDSSSLDILEGSETESTKGTHGRSLENETHDKIAPETNKAIVPSLQDIILLQMTSHSSRSLRFAPLPFNYVGFVLYFCKFRTGCSQLMTLRLVYTIIHLLEATSYSCIFFFVFAFDGIWCSNCKPDEADKTNYGPRFAFSVPSKENASGQT